MRIFILILILVTLQNVARADSSPYITTGLIDSEVQAVDSATDSEIEHLNDCMSENETNDIGDTSCINEVFGDVHN